MAKRISVPAHKNWNRNLNHLDTLISGAEHDDAECQCQLAAELAQGEGLQQDFSGAIYWYLSAAMQGYTEAIWNLGLIFAKDLYGVKGHKELGYQLIAQAAKNGQPSAMWFVVQSRPLFKPLQHLLSDHEADELQRSLESTGLPTSWHEYCAPPRLPKFQQLDVQKPTPIFL